MKRTKKATVPEPVKIDSRICFGIYYFTSEADAQAYAKAHQGNTYNGGFFHGMPCGRDQTWDHVDCSAGPLKGTKLYAVTT